MPRIALTDRFVASAKPLEGERTDYFDATAKGLALRVGKHGHKAWYFHFTSPRNGKRARVALGTYPTRKLSVARTLAVEAKGHVEDGNDPRDVFAAERDGAMTVAGLIETYLSMHVRPNLRSAAAVERRFNKNVLPEIGSVHLADLHKRDVNRVVNAVLTRGRRAEAGRVFEDMRACFRWAAAGGDLDHSPMEGMKKPSASAPRERVLRDEEIRHLWHELPKALPRSESCQRIIKLCLITGQRVGEVAGMRQAELDMEARSWALPGSRTKNASAHLVPLSDLASAIIDEALADVADDAEHVFPDKDGDGSLPPHAVARTIGRAHETAEDRPLGRFGIPHWTAHDLRRTVLTNFARLGIAPVVAGAVANHLSVTKATITLSVYTQYTYEAEKRDALDLWADRLDAIVKGQGAKVVPLQREGG
jgi:integrase